MSSRFEKLLTIARTQRLFAHLDRNIIVCFPCSGEMLGHLGHVASTNYYIFAEVCNTFDHCMHSETFCTSRRTYDSCVFSAQANCFPHPGLVAQTNNLSYVRRDLQNLPAHLDDNVIGSLCSGEMQAHLGHVAQIHNYMFIEACRT